jgi:hypothetical protein
LESLDITSRLGNKMVIQVRICLIHLLLAPLFSLFSVPYYVVQWEKEPTAAFFGFEHHGFTCFYMVSNGVVWCCMFLSCSYMFLYVFICFCVFLYVFICFYHVFIMFLSCFYHVFIMFLSCFYHVSIMFLSCSYMLEEITDNCRRRKLRVQSIENQTSRLI